MKIIEILITITIIVIISAWVWSGLSGFADYQMLMKDTENVLSALDTARYSTLESKSASKYGVHLQTDKVVVFKGQTYSSTDANNKTYQLSPGIELIEIALNGGGSNIVFERLSGNTSQYGKFALRSKSSSRKENFSVSRVGAVTSW